MPPYDCTLDECPKLDWSTDPPSPIVIAGVPQSAPAGSTAVRKIIEKYEPLLALTGHSTSPADSSTSAARRSSTRQRDGEGIIRGCILTLEPGKVVGYQIDVRLSRSAPLTGQSCSFN